MDNTACVSVIIPCFRCKETIARAVASVRAQTLIPSEVILVDDCSDDGTLALLTEIKRRYPKGWVHVLESSTNAGPATARNLGWKAASQPFIAFLDSDDSWHPDKIAIQYNWMLARPEVALTGHAWKEVISETPAFVSSDGVGDADNTFYKVSKLRVLLSNRFPTGSVMLRRELKYRFEEGKRYSEDFLLWADICCSGHQCYYSKLELYNSYKAPFGDSGLSAQLWNMQKGQLSSYHSLFDKGHFGLFSFFFLAGISFLKFVRRCIIRGVRA